MLDCSFDLHPVSCDCGANMAATETQTVPLTLAASAEPGGTASVVLSPLHSHMTEGPQENKLYLQN